MTNTRSKLLYGNAIYNEIHQQSGGTCEFPSKPIVRQAKSPKQQKKGRPRTDVALQASLAISPKSRENLKALERSVRTNYRALSDTPEFTFQPTGKVLMPKIQPMVVKKKNQNGDKLEQPEQADLQGAKKDVGVATGEGNTTQKQKLPQRDMTINDLEQAYGGFESDDVNQSMASGEVTKNADEGQDLPLPEDDEERSLEEDNTDAESRSGTDSESLSNCD